MLLLCCTNRRISMTSYHGKPQCVLTLNHVVISRVSYWTNMALLYHHSKADNSPGPTLGIKQFPIYHTIYIRPSEWGIVRIVDYWMGYNGFAHTDIHNVTFYPACTLQLYSGLRVHTAVELHCTLAYAISSHETAAKHQNSLYVISQRYVAASRLL